MSSRTQDRNQQKTGKSGKKDFQFQFSPVSGTQDRNFLNLFPSYLDGLVACQPGGFVATTELARNAEKLYNFKPRSSDVWIMTFPKSGTTWMQDLVWLVENNCDFEGAKASIHIRSPQLEMSHFVSEPITAKYERDAIARKTGIPLAGKIMELFSYYGLAEMVRPVVRKIINYFLGNMARTMEEIEDMEEQRIIKTHIPFYLLHPQLLDTSKVVYVARNPKDVIVSYYYYHKLMDYQQFTGNIETFAEYFIEDKMFNGPYFPHVFEGWSKRHHPNLHFVFYEDLKADLRGEIVKIATFLGKSLTDEQLTKLTEHLGFNKMKNNAAVNNEIGKEFGILKQKGHFIRKGITGDWKNHFSPEMNSRLDAWITKNTAGTDIRFVTELPNQE